MVRSIKALLVAMQMQFYAAQSWTGFSEPLDNLGSPYKISGTIKQTSGLPGGSDPYICVKHCPQGGGCTASNAACGAAGSSKDTNLTATDVDQIVCSGAYAAPFDVSFFFVTTASTITISSIHCTRLNDTSTPVSQSVTLQSMSASTGAPTQAPTRAPTQAPGGGGNSSNATTTSTPTTAQTMAPTSRGTTATQSPTSAPTSAPTKPVANVVTEVFLGGLQKTDLEDRNNTIRKAFLGNIKTAVETYLASNGTGSSSTVNVTILSVEAYTYSSGRRRRLLADEKGVAIKFLVTVNGVDDETVKAALTQYLGDASANGFKAQLPNKSDGSQINIAVISAPAAQGSATSPGGGSSGDDGGGDDPLVYILVAVGCVVALVLGIALITIIIIVTITLWNKSKHKDADADEEHATKGTPTDPNASSSASTEMSDADKPSIQMTPQVAAPSDTQTSSLRKPVSPSDTLLSNQYGREKTNPLQLTPVDL
jgi:cytoskeletal protein RodZ